MSSSSFPAGKAKGFDPSDCHNPVCGSKMQMFGAAVAKAKKAETAGESPPLECPVDREELGRSTWNLLHTTAAYYPEEPGPGEQELAGAMVRGLAGHYPCEHCAEDFREKIKEDPPSLGSRAQFMLWVCRHHNYVNDKLGKPTFNCTVDALDKRWKYGGPGCWSNDYDGYAHETLGKDIKDP